MQLSCVTRSYICGQMTLQKSYCHHFTVCYAQTNSCLHCSNDEDIQHDQNFDPVWKVKDLCSSILYSPIHVRVVFNCSFCGLQHECNERKN